jgi:hypothetical protein
MMRKLPDFSNKLVGVLMHFLLDIEVRGLPGEHGGSKHTRLT